MDLSPQIAQMGIDITSILPRWYGVLVACGILMPLGKLIDWGLRKRHRDAILSALRGWEERLKLTPLGRWQIHVATQFIRLVEASGRLYGLFRRRDPMIRLIGGSRWRTAAVFLLALTGNSLALYTLPPSYPWFMQVVMSLAAALVVVYLAFMTFGPIAFPSQFQEVEKGQPKRPVALRPVGLAERLLDWIMYLLASLQLSAVFTIIATAIGVFISAGHVGSFWFTAQAGWLEPAHPIALAVINFPFDFLTILVSLKLLQWVIARGRWISVVAGVDVVISALLIVALHGALKYYAAGGSVIEAFTGSWVWFLDVMTLNVSPAAPEWPLLPVTLTAFIPVAGYMSAIILLGFLAVVMRCAGYLCGLLGEKQHTPFFELATALSLLTLICKALVELTTPVQ
jgi:hypothetical protein